MPRVIPHPRGNYNRRLGRGLTRLDPSRTGLLRRQFSKEARRRFSRLFLEIRRLDTTKERTDNLSSTQFNVDELLEDVKEIQSLIDPDDVVELEEQPHITVRYGLHGQDAEQVQHLYQNHLPIRVRFGSLSLFPAGDPTSPRGGPEYDVLKIDVESRGLFALHQRLGLLPNTSTHSTYCPHLTVAYLKPGTGIKYVGESGLEGTELVFGQLVFSNDEHEHVVLENARTVDQHVKRFMKQYQEKVKVTVKDKPWWEGFINKGFQQGVGRAYDDLKKPLIQPPDQRKEHQAAKRQFLKSVVKGTGDRVRELYGKVEDDLDRITGQLGNKLRDYLVQARAEGRTLREAVEDILPKLEAEGLRRAENVANYRTVEAQGDGQLAAFEELGVEDVSVLVEWTLGPNPCPMCIPMEGVVLRPQDAKGLIPRHVGCQCAFEVVSGDEDDDATLIDDRAGIRRAVKASIKKEYGKGKFSDALEETEWGGADLEIDDEPLFNIAITPELLQFSEFSTNQFCPTGKGGGVDPSCSPSSTTKGGEKLYSATRGEDKIWRINGEPAPEHLQKLGIPPAWKEVEVNLDPKGTVLAKGLDAKGRVQTRYSGTHTAKQAAMKFGRTRELIQKREQIYKELDRDAKNPELKEQAECLKVVMQTGMRPGSDKDTKADHKSYGASTLEGRHVIANRDGTATLRLVTGKNKGREVDFPVTDKGTASMLKVRAKEAGESGRLFKTTASGLRDYSKSKDGGGFKTKDHRTALGTETALRAIKSMSKPETMKEYKAQVKEVATQVSRTLGNTPSIALKSYIDPQVFTKWNKGLSK